MILSQLSISVISRVWKNGKGTYTCKLLQLYYYNYFGSSTSLLAALTNSCGLLWFPYCYSISFLPFSATITNPSCRAWGWKRLIQTWVASTRQSFIKLIPAIIINAEVNYRTVAIAIWRKLNGPILLWKCATLWGKQWPTEEDWAVLKRTAETLLVKRWVQHCGGSNLNDLRVFFRLSFSVPLNEYPEFQIKFAPSPLKRFNFNLQTEPALTILRHTFEAVVFPASFHRYCSKFFCFFLYFCWLTAVETSYSIRFSYWAMLNLVNNWRWQENSRC